MSDANAVSDLERAEHLGYAGGKGVKRVSVFNDGVQVNVATEATQQSVLAAVQSIGGSASYRLIKMDYDGNADLSYKGQNTDDTAADADTDWSIIKYVRDVDGTLLSKITKTGSWEGRVALFS